jgi:hypothetical protein
MAIIPADEKVFMVDKRTNTTYGGSKALQDMQQWYTMQDVSDSIQPYKVFTASLTQSGGDATEYITSAAIAPFVIGVTYEIAINSGNADFTNIGAPNNNVDTRFIATGTTPNSWGDGGEVEIAYNTGAPVAPILKNTIGNVWFNYVDVGQYTINSDALFTDNKSQVYIPNSGALNGDILFIVTAPNNQNQTDIITYDSPTSQADNVLYQTPIEIRIYN